MVSQNATPKPTAYKTLRLFIDIAVATQHPQRKGLYEGNSRNGVICLSERIFSMNMERTARNLRVVLPMNLLVYTRLAL